MGLRLRGFPGWWVTRSYHLYQLPLLSRKLRVVADWTTSLLFRRDVAELGSLGHPEGLGRTSPRAGRCSACPSRCRVVSTPAKRSPCRCDAVEHDVHRERRRIELLVHLVPAQRRRHRRARLRPHRVDRRDRLARAVLVRVDEHAAPLRLRPLRRREPRVRARDRAGDDLGELARVVVVVAPLDRHEHVNPVGAARLRERRRARARRARPSRAAPPRPSRRSRRLGRRVEVEEDEVRPVGPVDARVPRVHVDAAHVHHPEQREPRRSRAAHSIHFRFAALSRGRDLDAEASGSSRACATARPSGRTPCRTRRRDSGAS